MKDFTNGRELENCNEQIKILLSEVNPKKVNEIQKFIDDYKFFVVPETNSNKNFLMSAYYKNGEIAFSNKALNIIWLVAMVYMKNIMDSECNTAFIVLKSLLLSPEQQTKITNLGLEVENGKKQYEDIKQEVESILSECSHDDNLYKNAIHLNDKQSQEYFNKIQFEITRLLNLPDVSWFEWPDSIQAPENEVDKNNIPAEQLSRFALSFAILHEIAHCAYTCDRTLNTYSQKDEELYCDKFGIDFIMDKAEEWAIENNQDSILVKQKRLFGILIGFFCIAEVTGQKTSENYPSVKERLSVILGIAKINIPNPNHHFWVTTASLLFVKFNPFDIQFKTAMDLVFVIQNKI